MSQFLINENMKMPAEAVAITGGSILGLLLGGTAECRCTSRLIGSFRPSVRRNAKPRWSWSPVRRESCRRVGPATAERRPIVCIVDDRGIFGPVILHFRILRTGFAWELHGGHHQGAALARLHAHALFLSWQLVHCSGGSLPQTLWRLASTRRCTSPPHTDFRP